MTSASADSCWAIRSADRVRLVVDPLVELRAVQVADPVDERRAEDLVIRVTRRAADPAARHAADELVAVDVDQDGGRDLLRAVGERIVERLGLHRGPREAVEDDAVPRVRAAEPLQQQADDDLVGDELPRVHVATRIHTQGGPIADGSTEQVPGGDHRDAEPLRKQGCLGALPGTGGAEKNDHVHDGAIE